MRWADLRYRVFESQRGFKLVSVDTEKITESSQTESTESRSLQVPEPATSANPGVQFPPPILFVVSCLAGVMIESQYPLPLSTLVEISGLIPVGCVATGLGTGLLLWGLLTFRRAQTAVYPNKPAKQLVVHGPFQFSRNPMYVALTLISLGVSLLADNIWMLMLLPLTLAALTFFVIQQEEAYLADEFEEQWTEYSSRVRRWL